MYELSLLHLHRHLYAHACPIIHLITEEVTDETEEPGAGHDGCKEETIYIFLVCGLALVAYTLILTMVSRMYKLRWVQVNGPLHNACSVFCRLTHLFCCIFIFIFIFQQTGGQGVPKPQHY